MLKMFLFVFLSAIFLASTSANEQAVDNTNVFTNDGADEETANKNIYAANNALVGMCLMNQISVDPYENFMTSLYPLLFRIALWLQFANEPTRTELMQIMNYESVDEMESVVSDIVARFNYDIPYNYTSEIKHLMLADNKYQFTDDFKNAVSSFIGGDAINIDYTDSSAVAAYCNEWMGQDILSSEQNYVDKGLISLSYNKIITYWDSAFRPIKKVPINFNTSIGTIIQTNALYFEGYAKYCKDTGLNSEVIEFPMTGDFKMRLFIPASEVQLDELIFQARSPSKYESAVANTKDVYLKLTVPIEEESYGYEEYSKGIKIVNMMTDTFDPQSNVFSSAFSDANSCQLSKMFHKMHLSIRDDTEMASEVSNDYGYDEVNVVVAKPFIMEYICSDNSIVLASLVQKPVEA